MKYKVPISGIIALASLLLVAAIGHEKYEEVRAYRQISLLLLRKFNPFSTGKIEKSDFWDVNNYTNFKHQ